VNVTDPISDFMFGILFLGGALSLLFFFMLLNNKNIGKAVLPFASFAIFNGLAVYLDVGIVVSGSTYTYPYWAQMFQFGSWACFILALYGLANDGQMRMAEDRKKKDEVARKRREAEMAMER
jgi:hypothetical protein